MGKEPAGNQIHVFPGAAETIPCPHGAPFPDLPTSFLLGAPTASGKTMIILNLLLRYYKDQFARIWIFSPSIRLDPQYAPLRRALEKMTDQQKEPLMFEDMDQAALGKVLDEQRKITEERRKRNVKPPQVCVCVCDSGRPGGPRRHPAEKAGRHLGRQLARDFGHKGSPLRGDLDHLKPVPEPRRNSHSQECEVHVHLEAPKL